MIVWQYSLENGPGNATEMRPRPFVTEEADV